MSYDKRFTRVCDYTPYVCVVNDGDGIRFEFREVDETSFHRGPSLSKNDVEALIKMLQEVIK